MPVKSGKTPDLEPKMPFKSGKIPDLGLKMPVKSGKIPDLAQSLGAIISRYYLTQQLHAVGYGDSISRNYLWIR